jgi:hypothetical protein
VEGSVGANYIDVDGRQSGTSVFHSSRISFTVSPLVGYWLNDKFAVGAKIDVTETLTRRTLFDSDYQKERKYERKEPEWGFSVFGRYKLLGKEKFSLLLESKIGMSGHSIKDKMEENVWKPETTSTIGFEVLPVITYDLTEKFSLITTFDFLSLGLYSSTEKDGDNGRKVKTNSFGFNAQSTIFKDLSNIKIGFIYKF